MKQIVVLGIYRSGTSMIAGILDRLGINIGDHGDLKGTANPKGYYEDQNSVNLNVKIREQLNKTHLTVKKKHCKRISTKNRIAIQNYIKQRNKEKVWGVKDPKMLPFFSVYQEYLDNPYLIKIRRNRKDIIDSWRKVDKSGGNFEEAHKNHLYVLNSIKGNILELHYKECLKNPKGTVDKIAKFIGAKPTKEAINFIDK